MPDAAKRKDLEGQKAFIRYWIDTYNYMRESGDPKPFLAACDSNSKFCSGSAKVSASVTKAGLWRVGDPIEISSIKAQGVGDSGADASVIAQVVEPAYEYFPTPNATDFSPRTSSQHHEVSIDLVLGESGWKLLEMGEL